MSSVVGPFAGRSDEFGRGIGRGRDSGGTNQQAQDGERGKHLLHGILSCMSTLIVSRTFGRLVTLTDEQSHNVCRNALKCFIPQPIHALRLNCLGVDDNGIMLR